MTEDVGLRAQRTIHVGRLIRLAGALLAPLVLVALVPHPWPRAVYLPTHLVMELFSVVVAATVFTIGWNTAGPARAPGVGAVAASFLAVALLDLGHLLSFQGMPDLVTPSGPSKAIYFWLASRGTAAWALAVFAWRGSARGARWRPLVVGLAWVTLVTGLVLFAEPSLPTVFVPGVGLTHAKIGAELLIVAVNVATVVRLVRRPPEGVGVALDVLAMSVVAMALSEVPFCIYASVTDSFNLLGHVEKVLAYALLYRAIFLESVREPYWRIERSLAALAQSEARFRQLADTMDEVMFLRDAQTRAFLYMSPGYQRIWQRPTPASALDEAFTSSIHPEDLPRLQASQVEQTRHEVTVEFRVLRPDGSFRWVNTRTRPVRDAQGQVTRVVGVARDVTEERALQAQLTTALRMETVARLAGGVAHDFNNLLTVILGTTAAARDEARTVSPQLDEDLGDIDFAARRAQALTRQLLSFARKDLPGPHVNDAGEVVVELAAMIRRLVGKEIEVALEVAPGAHRVLMDRAQLEQVVMNFAINARDAMPHGGSLRLGVAQAGPQDLARHGWAQRPGAAVLVSVVDTGEGMTDEVRRRAFDPFFTTKDIGHGTGLGLSTCATLAQQAGGSLALHGAPGQGTCAELLLPEAPESATVAPAVGAPAVARGEVVLVVDDEDMVRSVAARVLRQRGYTVLEASGGDEALAHLADAARVDLLLTDLTMPGMDGVAVAAEARRRRAGLHVLYMTGFTNAAPPTPLVSKPFSPEDLARAVRAALDGPGPTA